MKARWFEPAGGLTGWYVLIGAAAVFVVSQGVFLWGIDQPRHLYFDEAPYVGAALATLQGQAPLNREHPPLAKGFIALGIRIFGDAPLGWRCASACFGSVALVGLYLWGLALFGDQRAALWAAAAALCNQVLFIQARTAMLDVFALAFTLWGMAAFTAAWMGRWPGRTCALLAFAGVCFGLGGACKWSGFFPLPLVIGLIAWEKIHRRRQLARADAQSGAAPGPDPWARVGAGRLALSLMGVPFLTYYATFGLLGLSHLAPSAFLEAQRIIFHENSTVAHPHPYMSGWREWPLLHRGVWYLFQGGPGDDTRPTAQAILYLGNPLLLWGGLAAVATCLWGWIGRRRREALVISTAYFTFWLIWAFLPRRVSFAYYYLPAAMVLSLALAYAFYRTRLARWPWLRRVFLGAGVAVFCYFLPITSAAVGVSLPRFYSLMWLKSWR